MTLTMTASDFAFAMNWEDGRGADPYKFTVIIAILIKVMKF